MTFYALGLLGLPGIGKSTAVARLCRKCEGLAALTTREFHASGSRMSGYIHDVFVSGNHDRGLLCQVEALALRASLQATASAENCIDEPIEAVAAHTIAMHSVGILDGDQRQSWMRLYSTITAMLPAARVLALLTCERRELRRRTLARDRRRDESVDDRYLDALDLALREVAKASGSSVLTLDTTTLGVEEVSSALAREVKSRL